MALPCWTRMPDHFLAAGRHTHHDWVVMRNGMGFRVAYVRVPAGHPWDGKSYNDLTVDCHGGLTYDEADDGGMGWWVGMDFAHGDDAPDPELLARSELASMENFIDRQRAGWPGYTMRDQNYAEAEAKSVCEQAWEATRQALPETVAAMLAKAVLAGDLSAADALADEWIERRARDRV